MDEELQRAKRAAQTGDNAALARYLAALARAHKFTHLWARGQKVWHITRSDSRVAAQAPLGMFPLIPTLCDKGIQSSWLIGQRRLPVAELAANDMLALELGRTDQETRACKTCMSRFRGMLRRGEAAGSTSA